MRLSELRGLRWADVNLEAGAIHVRQRADASGKSVLPKFKAGKRDIPLAPIVVNSLRVWRLSCPKSDLDLVFPTRDGKPLAMQNFHNNGWYPLIENAASIITSTCCATQLRVCSSRTSVGNRNASRQSWATLQST